MWENETLERARQAFADQFEAGEPMVVYRRKSKGDPVALTVWERDALIFDFNRRVGWLYAALIGLVVLIMLGAWVAATVLRLRLNVVGIALVLGPIAAAYLLAERWIWNAPQRLIARRGALTGEVEQKAASPEL